MSKSMTQTVNMLYDLIKRDKKRGYDTTATITRVEGDTAWIHIPGGVDETPAKMTINAKPGDTVQVRVANGRAFLVGNASAPPTDNTVANQAVEKVVKTAKAVEFVQKAVEVVTRIAGNTAQYFWHTEAGTDTGVHITEIPQDEFLADPENGGGNLLARSNGVAVRDGLTELAQFSADGVVINRDGIPAFEVSATGTSESISYGYSKMITGTMTYDFVIVIPTGTSAISDILLRDVTYSFSVHLTYGTAASGSISSSVQYSYDGDQTITITAANAGGQHLCTVEVTVTINTPFFTAGLRRGTKAPFSAVIGRDLIASQSDQTVIGRYNKEDTGGDYVFVVGAGTDDSNRANALSVDWDGNVRAGNHVSGKVTDSVAHSYTVVNDQRNASFRIDADGTMGMYDHTNQTYVLRCTAGKSTVLSSPSGGATYVRGGGGTAGSVRINTSNHTDLYPVGSTTNANHRVSYFSMTNASTLLINAQANESTFRNYNIAASSSDIRLKKNVADTDVEALPIIEQIRMRQFDWKADDTHQSIGMIADEIEKIDPKLTIGGGYDENGTMNVKTIDTFYLIGYLVKALQELSEKVKELEADHGYH